MVECEFCKLEVVGSTPISGFRDIGLSPNLVMVPALGAGMMQVRILLTQLYFVLIRIGYNWVYFD